MGALWYMSKNSKAGKESFTSNPDHAVSVKFRGQECPVLAPGYVNGYARIAHSRQIKLWEHLLDMMEIQMDIDDNPESGQKEEDEHAGLIYGLHCAIAIMEFGVVDENSLELVKAQADIRYEQSMEE